MSPTFVEPISTVTPPDTGMEQDFELDIRVTNSTSTNTEEGPSGWGTCASLCATQCATACQGSCNHSCASVWYAWCCN